MDCGNLPDPANGRVSHTPGTTFGETATYSCNLGYNLVGDRTRTCQATGVWSESAPTCQCTLFLNMYQVKLHSKMLNFILPRIAGYLGGHYFTERTGTERNSSATLFYGTEQVRMHTRLPNKSADSSTRFSGK